MSIDAEILSALGELIREGDLSHQAVLIGGQAIRDWHAQQLHYLGQASGDLPMPRASMDIDVIILLTGDDSKLRVVLDQRWSLDDPGRQPHAYRWRRASSVTLDLVARVVPAP